MIHPFVYPTRHGHPEDEKLVAAHEHGDQRIEAQTAYRSHVVPLEHCHRIAVVRPPDVNPSRIRPCKHELRVRRVGGLQQLPLIVGVAREGLQVLPIECVDAEAPGLIGAQQQALPVRRELQLCPLGAGSELVEELLARLHGQHPHIVDLDPLRARARGEHKACWVKGAQRTLQLL